MSTDLTHRSACSRTAASSAAADRPTRTAGHRDVLTRLSRGFRRASRDDRGMATAEYAVGTVAAVALVTVLINVFRNKEFFDLLLSLVSAIFKAVLASKGFGL